MLHRLAEKSLLNLAQGKARPWERMFLCRHLTRCERCQALANDLLAWSNESAEVPADLLHAAQTMRSRVVVRIRSEEKNKRRLVSPWFFPALGAAAFGVLMIVLLSQKPQLAPSEGLQQGALARPTLPSVRVTVSHPVPTLAPTLEPSAVPSPLSPTPESLTPTAQATAPSAQALSPSVE